MHGPQAGETKTGHHSGGLKGQLLIKPGTGLLSRNSLQQACCFSHPVPTATHALAVPCAAQARRQQLELQQAWFCCLA